MLPSCEVTIQGMNVTKALKEEVAVSGAKEDLTFFLIRPVPMPPDCELLAATSSHGKLPLHVVGFVAGMHIQCIHSSYYYIYIIVTIAL